MTFESAQTNFQGQQGWNDLAPDALNMTALAQKNARGKTRPRRVVTPLMTAPPAEPGSRPLPPTTAPPTMTAPNSAPPKTALTSSIEPIITIPPVTAASTDKRSFSGPPPMAATGRPVMPPTTSIGVPKLSNSINSNTNNQPKFNIEDIKSELSQLYANPSALNGSEKDICVQKISNQLNNLSAEHCAFLKETLTVALKPEGKKNARKMVIDYSLLHSNVSTWTVPLRRLIDQQI